MNSAKRYITSRAFRRKSRAFANRCGGKLFQREDDRPESIKVRLEAYERSAMPLLEFYGKSGLLRKIPATGTPEEIHQRTISAINTRHVSQCAEQLWTAAENRSQIQRDAGASTTPSSA